VAGVGEARLRPQQALGARLRRREDELDVPAAARLEHQLGADRSLEALEARRTVAEAQELRDRARVIGARRIDGGRREELPAPAEQLLSEGREHPLAPVARGHERDAAAMLILENAPRRDARLILRRERVLIELRRSGPLRGQEVESEKRRVLCRKFRRRRSEEHTSELQS